MASVLTPEQIIDQVFSNLTGGVIPDFNTALTGGLFLAVIYFGGSIIFDVLSTKHAARRAELEAGLVYDDARNYLAFRDVFEKGSFDYDLYNLLYRSKLKESVDLSLNAGGTFNSFSGTFSGGSPSIADSSSSSSVPYSSPDDPGPTCSDYPYDEGYYA